jgi:chemotaxis protein MotA
MFVIIGIVVVIGAIFGGYLMEHGNVKVLIQPAELLIIGGASVGTVLIANPLHILKALVGGFTSVFGGGKFNKDKYLETLKMLYDCSAARAKRG